MKGVVMKSLYKILLTASVCILGNICVIARPNNMSPEINNTMPTIAILSGLAAAGVFGYKAYRLSRRVVKLRERAAKHPKNVELQEKLERVSKLYNSRLIFVGASLGLAAFGGLSYKRAPKQATPDQNTVVLVPDLQLNLGSDAETPSGQPEDGQEFPIIDQEHANEEADDALAREMRQQEEEMRRAEEFLEKV